MSFSPADVMLGPVGFFLIGCMLVTVSGHFRFLVVVVGDLLGPLCILQNLEIIQAGCMAIHVLPNFDDGQNEEN